MAEAPKYSQFTTIVEFLTVSRETNAWIHSSYWIIKYLQPANLTTCTTSSLFSLHVEPAPRLLLPLLDHPHLPDYKFAW